MIPNESKPHGRLPQHKALRIDDEKRMQLAWKQVRGERMVDQYRTDARVILDQKERARADLEQKDTPEEETDNA